MKKITFVQLAVIFIAGALMLSFSACQKSAINGSSEIPADKNQLNVRLTDDPGFFDNVNIDLKAVAVKVDTAQQMTDSTDHHPRHWDWDNFFHDKQDSNAIWDTLDIQPGVYDLAQLSNGADTLLSSGLIPKGRIVAIRLTLGTDNSIVKDSISYPLSLWNNNTDVYVRIYGDQLEKISSGKYRLWLDFDARHSIVKIRNGVFYLKPFIRAFVLSTSGSVQGNVLPKDAFPVISLYNSSDTLYALPRGNGFFMIPGVDAGTYSMFINASNGYKDTTITNIEVKDMSKTDIGVINLSK